MEVHAGLTVMLCLIASCYGGFFQLEHPQLAFCKADFVIRAHIESGPITEGNYFVFKITIKEVFKGLSLGRQGKAFGLLDAEFKTKLYSPDGNASDKVTGVFGIRAGIEYLLFGDILHGGRLFTKFSFLREEWNKTTPRKRANLRGYYGAGCRQCQFRPCGESDLECRKKLPGCEKRATQTPYLYQWTPQSRCWKRFEHCEVDASGQQCYWKETRESKRCKESHLQQLPLRDDSYAL